MFVLSGIDYKRKHGEVFIKFFFLLIHSGKEFFGSVILLDGYILFTFLQVKRGTTI